MKTFLHTARDAALLWYEKDADHMAATMSYYALFAMTPLLLLTVTIVSVLYGKDYVVATLYKWGDVLGPDILGLLHAAVANLEILSNGYGLPILGTIFFSGMVVVLMNTCTSGLHHLWGIPHQGIKGWVKKSINSILFVIVLEVYLLFLVGLDGVVSLSSMIGIAVLKPIFFIMATAVLFSLAYRILPWHAPSAKARLYGGLVASVLFLIAKFLVASYVNITPVPGLFGAAGLILALLIWIYAIAAILYYGAAFAHIYEKGSTSVTTQ